MSASQQIITICTAAVPVLASLGGMIRYLVRILASIERATELGQQAAETLARHIEQSGSMHGAIADQLTQHHGRLAILEAKRHSQ